MPGIEPSERSFSNPARSRRADEAERLVLMEIRLLTSAATELRTECASCSHLCSIRGQRTSGLTARSHAANAAPGMPCPEETAAPGNYCPAAGPPDARVSAQRASNHNASDSRFR